jgi:hypothetical protein
MCFGVVLSIQDGLESVALLVGSESQLVGGLLVLPLGFGLGLVTAGSFEGLGAGAVVREPLRAVMLGLGVGIGCWLVGVGFGVPIWFHVITETRVGFPLVHWDSLVACGVFGIVFGGMYSVLRRAFSELLLRTYNFKK